MRLIQTNFKNLTRKLVVCQNARRNLSNVCRVLRRLVWGLASVGGADVSNRTLASPDRAAVRAAPHPFGSSLSAGTTRERINLAGRAAEAAARFSAAYLSPESVGHYVASLLRQYAVLQRFTPRLHPDAVAWGGKEVSTLAGRVRRGGSAARVTRGSHSGGVVHGGCPQGDTGCCQRHPKACGLFKLSQGGIRGRRRNG